MPGGRPPIGDKAYPRELFMSPIYRRWADMKTRCNNPNWKQYADYGGRGIKVCARWTSFANFLEDMGPTFAEGLTLDRINNDGNYAPGNCRWADRITQCNNTRRNRIVEFRGEKATLAQWCRRLGLPPKSIQRRYYVQKWDIDRCLSEPIRPYRRTI
jgi:hypothetical protein